MSIPSLLRCSSRLLGVAALLSTFPVYAASSNHSTGMTGTLTSSNAEIMKQGSIRYFGMLGMDDFYDTASGNGEREARLLTGMGFGISPKLEAGIAVSFAHNTPALSTGTELRYLRGQAKYRFYGSRGQGDAAAVSLYSTTAELPLKPGLASGNSNTGIEFIYSELAVDGDTSYSLSKEQRDYKIYNAGSFSYISAPVLSLTASHLFRTKLNRNYELGLRMESATVSGVAYGNTYLVLGAHFATEQELSYLFGTQIDLASSGGPNRSRYYLGFTYTSKFSRKLGSNTTEQKPRLSQIKPPVVETLAKTQASLKKQPGKPVIKGCLAQVEIMDLSGSNGLAELLSSRLKKDGYCIRSIHKEANSHAYYSHLYYGLEKGETAVALAKKYKVQGEVSRRRLPSDVDIRFILGKDQR